MKTLKRLALTTEVSIIYKRPVFDSMPEIKCSQDAYSVFMRFIDPGILDYKEHFWILLLNRANRVLGISEISKGDTTGVIVNTKEIFQLALKGNATGLILCHNHPSGKLKYSKGDLNITESIYKIGKLLSIQLLDHLIITSENYLSFADENLINQHDDMPF